MTFLKGARGAKNAVKIPQGKAPPDRSVETAAPQRAG